MRDAESLMDQLVSYSDGEIGEEEVGMVLGLVSRDRIWSIIDSLIMKDADKTLAELHDLYYTGYDTAVILREMLEAVRELTIVKLLPKPEAVIEETSERIALMRETVKDVSATRLQQFYDLLIKAEYQGKMSSNDLSVLEMALLKMINLDEVVPVDEILNLLKSGSPAGAPAQRASRPASYAPTPQSGRSPAASAQTVSETAYQIRPKPEADDTVKKSADVPATPVISRTPGEVDWQFVKENASGFLAGALSHTNLVVEEGSAVLYYPPGDKYVADQCHKNKDWIEAEISKQAGRKMELTLQAGSAAPVASNEKKKSNGIDNAAKLEILNDPLIAKAIDIFEGRPEFEE